MEGTTHRSFRILLMLSAWIGCAAEPTVTEVTPHYGSLNGETRLTIYGKGFAANQFNFGDGNSNLGNKVSLVSDTAEFECRVHIDGSLQTQIMCYTPKGMQEDNYHVVVTVDGVQVKDSNYCNGNKYSWNCRYIPRMGNTPLIQYIYPTSGSPGTILKMYGRIFTDRFGSNIDLSTNGLEEKVLRVYSGPQLCSLKDTTAIADTFYGIQLNSETSTWGYMKCKMGGTYVGNLNTSFIIDAPYGRSLPDRTTLKIFNDDNIAMFQAYTESTSIYPTSGSTEGGLLLTIYGKYFDEHPPYTKARAYVGETICVVKEVQDTYLKCEVAASPSVLGSDFTGGRGLKLEYWNATQKTFETLEDIWSLSTSATNYHSGIVDEAYFEDQNYDNFVSRLSGYFIPPHDGQYQFFVKGDDRVKLYFSQTGPPTGKVLIAKSPGYSSNFWNYSEQSSPRFTLIKGKSYYLDVLHLENSGGASVQVGAKFYNTTLTSAYSGNVQQEQQRFRVNSTVLDEVQRVDFSSFTRSTETKAVQDVQIVVSPGGSFSDAKVRLGLFGVFTRPIALGTTSDVDVMAALNSLPWLDNTESFTVVSTPVTNGVNYTITINSKRGNFDKIEVRTVAGTPNVTAQVTVVTNGVSDMFTICLKMEGIPSGIFTTNATTDQVKAALEPMFGARCPMALTAPANAKVAENFESGTGSSNGEWVKNEEAFCGKYSIKNPTVIFENNNNLGLTYVTQTKYQWLCFAYQGLLKNWVKLTYTYTNASSGVTVVSITNSFDHQFSREFTSWHYECVNMYTWLTSKHGGLSFVLEKVSVERDLDTMDIFIDMLTISLQETTSDYAEINLQRLQAAKPNGALIDTVTVTSTSAGVYSIDLKPFDCGNGFQLFTLTNSQASVVSRITAASPPVTGTINVTFNGTTKSGINITLEVAEMKKELESIPNIGSLLVRKEGNCANFDLIITLNSLPGNQEQLQVDASQLRGLDPSLVVLTDWDGGAWYNPIPGDMLRTPHTCPQALLYINDIPNKCTGDCCFHWSSEVTPTVTAISPSSGTLAQGTVLTITGTGFNGTTTSNNQVVIGGKECTITMATTTSINCNVGNGPIGSYKVEVTVSGKGRASHPTGSAVMFQYTAGINSMSPSSGSLGGGTALTMTGYGFAEDAAVQVGTDLCIITSINPAQIVCVTPASATNQTVTVTVQQNGSILTSPSNFIYDSALTATITNITPLILGVQNGTIQISGSGFGSFANGSSVLFIGDVMVSITSYNNTHVTASYSGLSPGTQYIKLNVGANGFAINSNGVVPTVNVKLEVTNVYPVKGSLLGGTKITVTGSGFGTDSSDVEITVGSHVCDIKSTYPTKVICQIEDTATVFQITNQGTDPNFGEGYAFKPNYVEVKTGDIVRWTWNTPTFVNDISHSVHQTVNASAAVNMDNGFGSPIQSKNGGYQFRFTVPGTYYYWSGFVDLNKAISYRGVVIVANKSSHVGEVVVKVAGKTAIYNTSAGVSDPVDSSSCTPDNTQVSGCTNIIPTSNDSSKFWFAFYTCSTPIIESLSHNNGTTETTIVIQGNGFASTNCQNEVSFGLDVCTVNESAGKIISCKIDASGEPVVAVQQEVHLRVDNRGYALVTIGSPYDRMFGLLPVITNINPHWGSTAGGTSVTIQGSGFGNDVDAVLVKIGGYICEINNVIYSKIVCETQSGSEGAQSLVVQVSINSQHLTAECQTTTNICQYTYATDQTPVLSSVSPTNMTGPTTLTITGSKLGNDPADVVVTIGGEPCIVITVAEASLTCSFTSAPVGVNSVIVRVSDMGKASGSLQVQSSVVMSSITPSQGSIYGGTVLTISGNGFVVNDTVVRLDGTMCTIKSVALTQIICVTAAHAAATVTVMVTSKGQSYSSQSFEYTTNASPTIVSISPVEGVSGDTLTITGSNFAVSGVMVDINGSACSVSSSTLTSIVCTLGAHGSGRYPVVITVAGNGSSNTNVEFSYQLSITSISPNIGGIAGGQTVTISGQGFDYNATSVTICGKVCDAISTAAQSSTRFICLTPLSSITGGAQSCNVTASSGNLVVTLSNGYIYDTSLTPSILTVSPARGGTAGGTNVTISGSGFGTTTGAVSVTIDGSTCTVSSVTNTVIICVTSAHSGSIKTKVRVEVSGNGIAKQQDESQTFYYVDRWSSPYSWGGGPLPAAGEMVIISKGQTILLDTDTPVLSMLLIQGGQLIFDNEKDVELKSKIILITNGGLLQVGTETERHPRKAIITLYGHSRDRELPIYGTKVLALREGVLDLHGKHIPLTWTRLQTTAVAGGNTITLTHPVEWNVGDEIVIASTGGFRSQNETEKHIISSISADKQTLTLASPLKFEHLGVVETFGGTQVEFRAEVGLLTHNVIVRGNSDPAWNDSIEACPAGFDTGEFAVQTCFQGRFGEEIGSSGFGGHILIHASAKNKDLAIARIENVEVTFAGQEFRLGRYPIHFHLNGDMSSSYVRGCGIHYTFNRAVNLHGVHNTLVERTVIYNIKGGAFFLEDGIETGNTLQYNLALFVRSSTSLLNDDITPASFWVTNPNNTIQHNAVAGGTHFGYWYRMHEHPDGPSFDPNICPRSVPLGRFYNNSAHSCGWFGLWMFQEYHPTVGGTCTSKEPQQVIFEALTSWNNEKGAETVNGGALTFNNCIFVNNDKAGYEGKRVDYIPQYPNEGAMISHTLIVGSTTSLVSSQGPSTGIILPYGNGFLVKNVSFVNYNSPGFVALAFTRIQGTCSIYCGGYNYHFKGIQFINTPRKARFEWEHEGVLIDEDGTLTGASAGSKVTPTTGMLPNSSCTAGFTGFSEGISASICGAGIRFHRLAMNNILPKSMEGKRMLLTNSHGTSAIPFALKRLTHKPGWAGTVINGETYQITFENAEQIKNISFTSAFYEFQPSDYVVFELAVAQIPDRFTIDGSNYIEPTVGGLNLANATTGDWEWDNIKNVIRLVVSGTKRAKRGGSIYNVDREFPKFSAFKCFYTDCIPPQDPNTIPPLDSRPAVFDYWSNATWVVEQFSDNTTYYTIGNNSTLNVGMPPAYAYVVIPEDKWVVVDVENLKFSTLKVKGKMELDYYPYSNGSYYNFKIEATYIIIQGGRFIGGWQNNPLQGSAEITLVGEHSTPEFPPTDGPTVGSKVIGVFGGLDLHGKTVSHTWTKLNTTANVGDTQIKVQDAVDWKVGDTIVIAPTSYNAWETETFQISAISSTTITLSKALTYKHLAFSEMLPSGKIIEMRAEVGLLTRNVKVIGKSYVNMDAESFGARIIVSSRSENGLAFTGYARLSNVEFVNSGQEGYYEFYDARFSITYSDTGTVSNIKPSYVKGCAFHDGFSPAIGLFGANGMIIENNVIHHTVKHAIWTASGNTTIRGNLAVLNIWTGGYQNRSEEFNIKYEAAIEAFAQGLEATGLTLIDNAVAASERVCYHVPGTNCDDGNTGKYINNIGHSCLVGASLFPLDADVYSCTRLANFTLWKNHDYGLYYNNDPSTKLTDNVVIENGVNVFSMVIGPSSLEHQYDDKFVYVSDTVLVGRTSSFDCSKDVLPSGDPNIELSSKNRPGVINGGMVGLVWTTFTAGSNMAPEKPFANIMTYQAIGGSMHVSNVTFAHFQTSCSTKTDFAIATSERNDDANHPLTIERATLVSVDDARKLFIHRPNTEKINPADCVDMDCDAKKKTILTDLDGSFLGKQASVISQSEFEWDVNPVRGLGDYRIPKELLTDPVTGARLNVNSIATKRGIIRNENCTLSTSWQGWLCQGFDYLVLTIESMDADTETRRLSPVAIVAHYGNGYIDLINGPQDHGWCAGYTCQKRLSTFQAVVAAGHNFDLFFTSTSPQHSRYLMLDASESQAVRICVYYSEPNRLDVYLNGTYVLPKNAEYTSTGAMVLKRETYEGQYMPNVNTDASGTNYINMKTGIICFIVKGPRAVEIKTAEVIMVAFGLPMMTVDDFFGKNLVQNLAAFLSIPYSKIRIVNIINEQSSSGRRKRETSAGDKTTIEVEIGNLPASGINGTGLDLSHEQLMNISYTLQNEIQSGRNISDVLNTTILSTSIASPLPNPGSEEWASFNPKTSRYVTYNPVESFEFHTKLTPASEGSQFSIQPILKFLDRNGYLVVVGSAENEWHVLASIRAGTGHPQAVLSGNVTVSFIGGLANFTDLSISHMGQRYILDFNISQPGNAQNWTLSSEPFDIPGRKISASQTISGNAVKNAMTQLVLDLIDGTSLQKIEDISWRDHTWNVTASSVSESSYGTLTGTLTTTFNPSTGKATFSNLNFTAIGPNYVKYRIMSEPAGYDEVYIGVIHVMSSSHVNMVVEETSDIVLKFPQDYNQYLSTETARAEFHQLVGQYFANKNPDSRITAISSQAGSIIVTITVDGTTYNVNTTLFSICDDIESQTPFTFSSTTMYLSSYMVVDGVSYYGVTCGPKSSTSSSQDNSLHPAIWAAVAIAILLILIVLVAFILWKCKIYPKTKTHADQQSHEGLGNSRTYIHYGGYYYKDIGKAKYLGGYGQTVEEALFREKTFTSLRGEIISPLPPVNTQLPPKYEELLNARRIRSPVNYNSETPGPLPIKEHLV
ncbi:hypothetical protein CHS0354_042441 [Potamilus streckersoni]|uniref:Fibrocystin-L n=1 Tax=Potamilus streckersoni TaxID=2493646 RepID=A0AAE0S9J1_9BIVA|nr:hypothetical protein CHS0354_042441 [Potamilus streckersoni]